MKKKKDPLDKADKKLSAKALQNAVLQLLQAAPEKRYSPRHIAEALGISNNKDSIRYALEQLVLAGDITLAQANMDTEAKSARDKTKLDPITQKPVSERKARKTRSEKAAESGEKNSPEDDTVAKPKREQHAQFEGTVDVTRSGAAYVVCEGLESDVFVPAKLLKGALHGDTVRVSVYYGRGRRRPDGEVVEVLKRAMEHFIGVFHPTHKFGVVIADREGLPDIYVENADILNAQDGEKVVVKITKWTSARVKNPIGIITAVLGMPGGSDLEMKSILINKGFDIVFPEEVLAESEQIEAGFTAEEIARRRDMRDVLTLTIDPHDAKDFDDALSIRRLDNGNTEVGIHIADVSHYLRPNTALDREAYHRSTSVYLVDRVCPMLPEKLSNELCSLRPHEDKMTFSAVFEFDEAHKIVGRWFGKTVTHSNHRYTYESAQTVLETGEGENAAELLLLNTIALSLRKSRFKAGAINFETDEVRFKLDEDGTPLEVYIKERKDSNMLIEDFMLLANREVATFMGKREGLEVPYIYRIHDSPDLSKLEDFAGFAKEMGVKMKLDTPEQISKSINDLVKKAETDESLKLLVPLAIRCMAKAEYSSNNIGHYGLAFEYYSHFTSPIRRYSDVIAHRLLEKNLHETFRADKEDLEARCKHISKQERKATEAERESIKYKQVEFIKNHVGEVFDGQISGMLDRGIFVELIHSHCEGLISFERIGEAFEVESSRLRARGVRSGKVFHIGDHIRVRIIGADLEKRQIDMVIENEA
jgi:ribonuclease R